MDNRIRCMMATDFSLVPAEAEVYVTVTTDHQTPTTEVRGRLMGPRCHYASTVEVAYPLRPLPPDSIPPLPGLTMRVIIPEASLWDTESPFIYEGPIELWQDGRCRDRQTLRHGLRSFHLGSRGLRVNGRPLTLRGRAVTECSDEEALELRRAGYNLLVAPIRPETLPLWEMADRLGFLVLGRAMDDKEETENHMAELWGHPSVFGWLFEPESMPVPPSLAGWRLGVVLSGPPGGLPPSLPSFLVGPASSVQLGQPLLVEGEVPAELVGSPGIIGTID